MGWQLAEEMLDHCPDIGYREFRLLMALALDARTETRQSWAGAELMALRCNCGIRTVERAMAGLVRRGLVKVASQSRPGRRAVYEILPLADGAVDRPPTPDTSLTGDTPDSFGATPDTSLSPTPDTEVADLPSVPSISPVILLAAARVAAALGTSQAETMDILKRIEAEHCPRDIARYVAAMDRRGDLARYLPCGRPPGSSHLSEACRRGDSRHCQHTADPAHWCDCRCHPRPP